MVHDDPRYVTAVDYWGILIPTLILIMPAVFVVLAGPAWLQIQQAFAEQLVCAGFVRGDEQSRYLLFRPGDLT